MICTSDDFKRLSHHLQPPPSVYHLHQLYHLHSTPLLTDPDIYATSLARFFATLNPNLRSCSLTLPSPIETIVLASSPSSTASSPPSSSLPRHGIELSCADATWRWGLDGGDDSDGAPVEVTWSCVVTTTWVPLAEEGVLRMEKMEIVVEGIKGGGWEWGMPEEAIRVLEVSFIQFD